MSTQNVAFRALFSLSLLLLLTVTACGETPLDAGDNVSENTQTAVETAEATPAEEMPGVDDVDTAPTESVTDVVLGLSGDGVLIIEPQSGQSRTIPFETDIETAQTTISAALGEPTETAQNSECGAGPMSFITWSNGFTINAMQDQFIGWTVRSDTESENLTTLDGVGVGSTLADLEANYTVEVIESSLGTEFNASDSLFGLLSANEPTGVITNLWSGIACNFR